jgi:nucleotide-binding universal stress UspA family protein
MQLNRILVAVKPWQRGLPLAANHARQLAQLAGAAVQLVGTVFDARAAAGSERGDPAASVARDRALRAARVDLERLADSLRDWGASVTTRVVWGVPPYEGILAAAREWRADLVVVGTHERDLHARLTDTDWQLMRRAVCPLLLVKSPSFGGYRTIVAAVDPLHAHGEPDGLDRAVLDAGRSIARACGSTLRAVYAYPGAEAFGLASAVEVASGVFYGAENVEAVHRRAVDELAEQFGVAAGEVDLVVGPAPQVIVDTVAKRGAELVVVGTPRRRGLVATALGSTAELVVTAVPCDVLLVPAP